MFAATVIALSAAAWSGQSAASLSPMSPGAAGAWAQSTATGCPALGNKGDNSGLTFVGLLSPDEAVARSVAQITDAWYAAHGVTADDFFAERLAAVASLDKNGDGLICLATLWGQNLNPNSHWALIEADLLSPPATERWGFADHHVGTSNKR